MLWARGHPDDYDSWRLRGWTFDALEKYFVRAENFAPCESAMRLRGSDATVSLKHRGKRGPVAVRHVERPNFFTERWLEAAVEAGLPFLPDYNDRVMHGCTRSQVAIDGGRRVSAASAYLSDAVLARRNLTVRCCARVTRALLEGRERRAVGVEFAPSDDAKAPRRYALAQREVVLCAGTVQTPQLLMLSGVGARAELAAHGIECLVDLPGVGKNMQDHCMVPLMQRATTPLTLDLSAVERLGAVAQYLFAKSGPAVTQALEAMAFTHTTAPKPEQCAPDVQFHMVCAGLSDPRMMENLGFEPSDYDHVSRGFTTLPTLLHPKSRGAIELASPCAFAAPRIVPNYLVHPDDLEVLVRGIKIARRIHASLALHDHSSHEYIDPELAAQHHPHSDEYIREYIRRNVITVYHPVGTCKMGAASDPSAVVSPDTLAVHGTVGLRVVDCSIFPTLMSANTQAPAYIAGEKAADLILFGPSPKPAHHSKL
jgi:choline dehydrogenase-like flavoprotein